MQINKKYLAPLVFVLALPLGGCLSASSGLDYSRSDAPPPSNVPVDVTPGPTAVCADGTRWPCK
jgi:hypothetical protein